MGFHVTRCLETQAAAPVYLANECFLRGLPWLREGWGMTVLVGAGSSNYGANRVPVRYRVGKPLEHEDNDTLSSCIAVGAVIKTVASTIR